MAFSGLYVGPVHLIALRFLSLLRYRPSKCYDEYANVFGNHRGCLFTNDCGSRINIANTRGVLAPVRAALPGMCPLMSFRFHSYCRGRGLKPSCSITTRMLQFLFLWLVWNKGQRIILLRCACMAICKAIIWAKLSCFKQKCSDASVSFSCGLVWVIIIIHRTFVVEFTVKETTGSCGCQNFTVKMQWGVRWLYSLQFLTIHIIKWCTVNIQHIWAIWPIKHMWPLSSPITHTST